MHPHAVHAIRAAANWSIWGSFAASRYAAKRGVPARLVRLARQLHATREMNHG
jgi:hypothetical protein